MIIELIIALSLGIIIGIITGLFPGIHINLVAAFLLASSVFLLNIFQPISLAVFIVSLSITHIFTDFIPTIFLGAPDSDTTLSILPGHEMLIKGEGYEAVILSIIGALIGVIILLPFIPIFIYILPIIYPYVQRIIPIILITIIFMMILSEKGKNKFLTILIIFLSGCLGYFSLNLNIKEALLPLLTGLFGSSSLITSILKKQEIPIQNITKIKAIIKNLKKDSIIKSISASVIASPICSFLPSLGSSQASIIGSIVIGELDRKEFIILNGIVNTLVMSLSFIILYSIKKSRTGSSVAINTLLPSLTKNDLEIIILAVIVSAIFAFLISIMIVKNFSKLITKINYTKLSILILSLLTIVTLIFSGIIGLIILITSTALGVLCILSRIKRTSLMGCLLIPTIILYLL
ncbi:Tripartite tricarboxylate transporter TctA family protein [uncultured archaeon]|nr:Tripartite tricarboxylate transporter TctA family protein [uncultured archaeon]